MFDPRLFDSLGNGSTNFTDGDWPFGFSFGRFEGLVFNIDAFLTKDLFLGDGSFSVSCFYTDFYLSMTEV